MLDGVVLVVVGVVVVVEGVVVVVEGVVVVVEGVVVVVDGVVVVVGTVIADGLSGGNGGPAGHFAVSGDTIFSYAHFPSVTTLWFAKLTRLPKNRVGSGRMQQAGGLTAWPEILLC